ncbi:MAG: alpha/beta hydrolase [Austwickia sp.]|nr:alpha/beta hydrolase [Austwickia sp.]
MPTSLSTCTTITTYDGATLAVQLRGAPTAEPLLLIAGQGLSGAAWDPAADGFAARYRVITYDHRGTGGSEVAFPGEPPQWSTRQAARDAIAVLDRLGVARAHVYGHSMGGRIAQWLAAEAPHRVAALILGGTTGGDSRGVPRREAISAALASGDPDVLGPLFFRASWLAEHPEYADVPMRTTSPVARRAHFAASQSHDAWDVLGTIAAPTLVMHALDDEVCPSENARLLTQAIPDAELHLLDDGRHVYYAGGREANEAVLSFLRRHPLR